MGLNKSCLFNAARYSMLDMEYGVQISGIWYVEYGALAAFLFAGSTGTTSGREMWIRGCAKITFESITSC